MNINGVLDYLVFNNPVVTTTVDLTKIALSSVFKPKEINSVGTVNKQPPMPFPLPSTLLHTGSAFVRIAGLSGALAVVLGAYGAHTVVPREGNEEVKKIFETANKYHFLHTVALLGVPLCRWQNVWHTICPWNVAVLWNLLLSRPYRE